jgi:hypothetical protein
MMSSAVHSSVFAERAVQMGAGLEVANAIRDYLQKAGGDARLALALSVADVFSEVNRPGHSRPGERAGLKEVH